VLAWLRAYAAGAKKRVAPAVVRGWSIAKAVAGRIPAPTPI